MPLRRYYKRYLLRFGQQNSLKKEYYKNISSLNEETENSILLAEYEDLVNDILENIPTQKRSIFILSRQQGKSNEEIADLLGITQKIIYFAKNDVLIWDFCIYDVYYLYNP